MRRALFFLLVAAAGPVVADVIVPTRTIRAQEIIGPDDIVLKSVDGGGAVTLQDLIGQEARVALYPGRAIHAQHVGPPTLVDRNQVVPLIYARGGLRIMTDGRVLARAGAGDYVRVMNLSSRATVMGRVLEDGRIEVSR